MKVNNIFYSLQGEGIYRGLPMTFIRLQGCNLNPRCQYCDSLYASNLRNGEDLSLLEVIKSIEEAGPLPLGWVCITGGEPLWQLSELEELVRTLYGRCRITIETNGSLPVPKWSSGVDSWSTDIKCPSSGVCGTSKEEWWNLRAVDQIKFVVGTQEDLDFAGKEIEKHKESFPTVVVSPILRIVDDVGRPFISNRGFLQDTWNFCMEHRVRYSLQDHKIVFGDRRGV